MRSLAVCLSALAAFVAAQDVQAGVNSSPGGPSRLSIAVASYSDQIRLMRLGRRQAVSAGASQGASFNVTSVSGGAPAIGSSAATALSSSFPTKLPIPCEPNPAGAGPTVNVLGAVGFRNYRPFADAALSAEVPEGYRQTFKNLNGSVASFGFLGYIEMSRYDVAGCAAHCDHNDGCLGINIFFKRNPLRRPADECPNPPETTNIRCALWAAYVGPELDRVTGQMLKDFETAVAGSNGYMKDFVPVVRGFSGVPLGNNAINAPPTDCLGQDSYIGDRIFTGRGFLPSRCAEACIDQIKYALRHTPKGSKPKICRYFNTYQMLTDGKVWAQHCAMYTQTWGGEYATNQGQWRNGTFFQPVNSLGYARPRYSGTTLCRDVVKFSDA